MVCRQAAYVWLGAGAIALGMGAAFAAGAGTAHADNAAAETPAQSTTASAGTTPAATTNSHRKHHPIGHVAVHRARPVKTRTSRKTVAAQSVGASSTTANPATTIKADIAQQAAAIDAERHAFGSDLRTVQHGPALIPHLSASQLSTAPAAEALLHASATLNHLAAGLNTSALHVQAAESTVATWKGPVASVLVSAAQPYVGWLNAAARQAESAATQALAAGTAFEAAFATNIPATTVAANRSHLAALVATNFFGGNIAAIAATEAMYVEMWAQDVGAMLGYHRTTGA